ncbi:MAG TPA: PQQ-binding-like beta-propeller repeat protein [Planctomycetota bacterium]|nr:PQQ-binding-like beta-propeller repeat protein [Planctomycetota bacterium]
MISKKPVAVLASFVFVVLACSAPALAQSKATADWSQFRGPGGQGTAEKSKLPVTWSASKNIVWKTELPGPGTSSPVILGDKIYLTCHTGFGQATREKGEMESLKRHVLRLDRASGKIVWNQAIPAELPEQERIREDHGYASSTPAVDDRRVYVFFGKGGVFAFDHDGKQLWRADVGSTLHGWGSATSPVLYKGLVFINASVESESLVALNRETGKEVWRAGGIKESWNTPILVETPDGKTELFVAMMNQVLAFDPDRGQPLWNCDSGIGWYICPSAVTRDGIVYSIGGRSGVAGLAVRAGGRGNVTESHRLWRLNKGSNVSSPVFHDGHIYFASDSLGIAYCVNARTGDVVYEKRLEPSPGQLYASAVLADGKIYYVSRNGRTVVLAAKPEFEQLAHNDLGDRSTFNASPAIAGDRLLLRSDKFLYCIGEK